MKQKIDFITYGDSKKYSISKKHLIGLAEHSKFFDNCIAYGTNDLNPKFVKRFSEVFNQERGGGYYIWKLSILIEHLKQLNNNDILIYCDSGSSLNFNASKRFYEYIEIINNSEYGNLRFESKKFHIEKNWTSKELFDFFEIEIDSSIGNSTQLLGGHLIFKKNDHTEQFMQKFNQVVNTDYKLITDFYNSNQISEFQENRHDQSIMSLITKKYGGEILPNETFFDDNLSEQYDYPFLSVRHYGHGFKDRIKFGLGYKSKSPIYFN